MNNISLLLPKNRRPVWTADFTAIDEELDNELSNLVSIPLLGKITAGKPIERIEDNEQIKVPANMVRKDTYALKVCGHSMIDDNIQDGDIVIIEKKMSAENGQSAYIGNLTFLREQGIPITIYEKEVLKLENEGKTTILVLSNNISRGSYGCGNNLFYTSHIFKFFLNLFYI